MMEEENYSYKLWQLYRIANTLFWINLLPALIAICVCVFYLVISINHPEGIISLLVLIPGLYCEWVYYKQRSDQEYLTKRFGWLYSIILNVVCIVIYIAFIFVPDIRVVAIMGIYPLGFLIASCVALSLTIKLKS